MPLDAAFWENEHRLLLAILRPRLTQMALAGMQMAARQAAIAFDNTLYNQHSEEWARNYTDQLLAFLGTTNEKVVGEIIAEWTATPGATIGDLNDKLKVWFEPVRANRIAVTETTRAFAQGQKASYQLAGITEWVWRTNRDELVCPICGPLNNKKVKIGSPFGRDKKGMEIIQPPAHVNCRCWVAPVAASENKPPVSSEGWKERVKVPAEIEHLAIQQARQIVPNIIAAHNETKNNENGSTFSLRGGNMAGKDYYSTSIYPDLSFRMPGKDVPPEVIKQFIINNIDLLSNKRVAVGTWYNKDDGYTYVDISVLVRDENIARRLSERYNQIGMFHLGGKGYIPTGGTGEELLSMPFRLDRL